MPAAILYPIADSGGGSNDHWTLPAYSKIDEVTPDDSDYTSRAQQFGVAPGYSDLHYMQATAIAAPSDPSNSTVRVRVQRTASGSLGGAIVITVYDADMGFSDSFTVTEQNIPIDGSFHTFYGSMDLSFITNWANVQIWLEASCGPGGTTAAFQVSWLNVATDTAPPLTNRVVAKFPANAQTPSLNDFQVQISAAPNQSNDICEAMNQFAAHNTGGGLPWQLVASAPAGSNTPPTIPASLAMEMWDVGTDSPDGQLPEGITILNVRLAANISGYGAGVTTCRLLMHELSGASGTWYSQNITTGHTLVPPVADFPVNPATGLPWQRADLFAFHFGLEILSVSVFNPLPNTSSTFYRVSALNPQPLNGTTFFWSSHGIGRFLMTVTYEVGPTVTAVTPSGAPGECGIEITGTGFVDGDEGSICAPGTSVVSDDGTTLTCCLPAAGELTVGGDPFDPGLYSVTVGTATLAAAFTGDVLMTKSIPFLNPIKQFLDSAGNPLAGGKVYTYESDSNTPQDTFTDPGLTDGTQNTNPIILDDQGKCIMWMLPTTYRVTVTDANDVVQENYPIDGVPGSIWPGAIGAQVTTTPAANANSLAHQYTATMNKASTGTHALFAANFFAIPTIVAGGATLTEATTVYIAGPPSAGSSVYALHVATGISKFSGAVETPGGFTGSVGFYGTVPIAQQVLATGTGKTVDNVITALQALGLVKQA